MLSLKKAGDSVIDSIMKGFTAGGILIADGSTVDYYDIELQDENGQAVMLESGKIQITFAYKEGIDYSKVNVIVYHLNEKTGVIESWKHSLQVKVSVLRQTASVRLQYTMRIKRYKTMISPSRMIQKQTM